MEIGLILLVICGVLFGWKETAKDVIKIWAWCLAALLAFAYLMPVSPILGVALPLGIAVHVIRHAFFPSQASE